MNMATVCIIMVCTALHIAKASTVNVALGKPASMSSSKSGYNASIAVDGDTDAGVYGAHQIIDTDTRYSFAWWKVDLQREVQNATVRIYFRTDYKKRRNGVKLYTSTSPFPNSAATSQGQLCHTVTGDPSGSNIPDVYNITCPGRWRYLLLYTATDNDGQGAVLDFGEVEVLACSNETYGGNCDKTCSSRNCVTMTTTCENDARCPGGCQTGWIGLDCTQALPPCTNNNYYGQNCDKLCSARKCKAVSTSSCDRLTGRCPDGCQDGWREEDCHQKCESSYYGPSCVLICNNRRCLSGQSTCDHVTGQCEGGCQAGYEDVDCRTPCSPGVTYGVNCSKSCSSRHCVNSPRASVTPPPGCDPQIGQCTGECAIGWGGLDCASPCPRRTYGSNCSQKCGECDGVCDSVSGLCYEGCLDGYRGAWCNVTRTIDAAKNNYGAVVGSVLGTLLVVIMVVVGFHILLVRQGRLQWVKSSDDKKPVEMSHDITEFGKVPQSSEVYEHVHARGHVHTNNYDALDPQLITGNKDYDVIQHKEYQNVRNS